MPSRIVIGFVQAQMLRFPISRLRRFHNNGSRLKELCIVNVGPSRHDAQRAALPFDQQACFDPRLCSVRRADLFPPKRALPIAQSAACHSQSTPPNSWQRSMSTAHILMNTPRSIHLWKVRWMVLSSPSSLGRWFHWQPLLNLWMMPFSILLWSTRLRPVALGGSASAVLTAAIARLEPPKQSLGSLAPSFLNL